MNRPLCKYVDKTHRGPKMSLRSLVLWGIDSIEDVEIGNNCMITLDVIEFVVAEQTKEGVRNLTIVICFLAQHVTLGFRRLESVYMVHVVDVNGDSG